MRSTFSPAFPVPRFQLTWCDVRLLLSLLPAWLSLGYALQKSQILHEVYTYFVLKSEMRTYHRYVGAGRIMKSVKNYSTNDRTLAKVFSNFSSTSVHALHSADSTLPNLWNR